MGGSANPVKRASAVGMERLASLRMALPVLGPIVLQRLEMCRPQVWLAGFALLVVTLLRQP